MAEIGIKGVLNPAKGITLSLYNGRELPFVFSRGFESLLSQNYTDGIRDCANVALIAGEGEGIERKLAVTGGETGLSRKEVFVDARDLRLADYENDDTKFMGDDKDENGNFVINEKQAKVVKRIFSDYLDGKGPNRIARELEKDVVLNWNEQQSGIKAVSEKCSATKNIKDDYGI